MRAFGEGITCIQVEGAMRIQGNKGGLVCLPHCVGGTRAAELSGVNRPETSRKTEEFCQHLEREDRKRLQSVRIDMIRLMFSRNQSVCQSRHYGVQSGGDHR